MPVCDIGCEESLDESCRAKVSLAATEASSSDVAGPCGTMSGAMIEGCPISMAL